MKPIKILTPLKTITLTAMYLAVIVVLEASMIMLPNVQLTVLLMMVFATVFPRHLFIPFVTAYVIIDNFTGIFLAGSIDFFLVIPMFIGWTLLLYVTSFLAKKSFWLVLIFSFLFGFIYGWIFIPAHIVRFGITTLWPYIVADLPFELTMAISNVVSVFLLYRILVKQLQFLLQHHPSES